MSSHEHGAPPRRPAFTSRRFVMTAAACAVALRAGEAVADTTGPLLPEDEHFMRIALDEARRGDYPFGAVIVRAGQEIARGHNLGRTNDDPTAHGEMMAIRHCLAAHGSAALVGCTLYTSGEPCAMCTGAIIWCGFGRLVFAATVQQLSAKIHQINISSAEIAARAAFNPISITGGVLAAEEMQLFAK
jgi:tRNA(Arg) A34 adenosine deaminase TadA